MHGNTKMHAIKTIILYIYKLSKKNAKIHALNRNANTKNIY
jgi:hypothetical protein